MAGDVIYCPGPGMNSFECLPEHLRHTLPEGTIQVNETKDKVFAAFDKDCRMRILPSKQTDTMPSFDNIAEDFDVERMPIPEFISKLLPPVRFNVVIKKDNDDCGEHCKVPGSQSCGTFKVEYRDGEWGRRIIMTVECSHCSESQVV
jgi:hypothetical protein